MVFYLGADCTKLEEVGDEVYFTGQVDRKFDMLGASGVLYIWREGNLGFICEERGDVVDNGFDVVCRPGEFPETLVGGGLIMEGCDYEGSIDGPSAPCSVLEYLFCLFEVSHGFVVELLSDAVAALGVELIDFIIECFYLYFGLVP